MCTDQQTLTQTLAKKNYSFTIIFVLCQFDQDEAINFVQGSLYQQDNVDHVHSFFMNAECNGGLPFRAKTSHTCDPVTSSIARKTRRLCCDGISQAVNYFQEQHAKSHSYDSNALTEMLYREMIKFAELNIAYNKRLKREMDLDMEMAMGMIFD